jgi:hypothetical protein
MRHDSGLAASPPVRHILGVEGRGYSPFACPLWMDKPFAKRRRGAHAGTVGPGRSPVGLRMQPPNEEFFPSSAKPARTSSRASPFPGRRAPGP